MIKNTDFNRTATKMVAKALGELNDQVIYVGGAVVSLYIDDPAAEDVRPTKDIDISMNLASMHDLEKLREELQKRGFKQTHEEGVICRFILEDELKVDVMNTTALGWAPANPWFAPGLNDLVTHQIDEYQIKCLSLPYFLATKFTAFRSRGAKDPRTSHDFEDIIYLLNHTSDWIEQVQNADTEVKTNLISEFDNILNSSSMQEAMIGHLFFEDQDYHYNKILSGLKQICHVV